MNRRELLTTAGGAFGAFAGGGLVAAATRADVVASRQLTRGGGEPATVERRVDDEVEYLAETNEVDDGRLRLPFERWAHLESHDVGSSEVRSVVDDRIRKSVEGIGSGVRYLLFGPVITVDHAVTYDREGEVVSEPNVSLDRVVSAAPRTLTLTVSVDGREYTESYPVGVGHVEYYNH